MASSFFVDIQPLVSQNQATDPLSTPVMTDVRFGAQQNVQAFSSGVVELAAAATYTPTVTGTNAWYQITLRVIGEVKVTCAGSALNVYGVEKFPGMFTLTTSSLCALAGVADSSTVEYSVCSLLKDSDL